MHMLDFLVKALQHAKKNEEIARKERVAVEEKIANFVETKEVGQKTVTLEDGTKITVKRGLNYKANIDGMRTAFQSIGFPAPIKTETKYTLDVKGYEWYKGQNPEVFAEISSYVTVTPKKVAVTLQAPKE